MKFCKQIVCIFPFRILSITKTRLLLSCVAIYDVLVKIKHLKLDNIARYFEVI